MGLKFDFRDLGGAGCRGQIRTHRCSPPFGPMGAIPCVPMDPPHVGPMGPVGAWAGLLGQWPRAGLAKSLPRVWYTGVVRGSLHINGPSSYQRTGPISEGCKQAFPTQDLKWASSLLKMGGPWVGSLVGPGALGALGQDWQPGRDWQNHCPGVQNQK